MLKNYFIIAWRTLVKNKAFSLTNILGLTIGMTCTILIFLWVHDEIGYDRFHRNYSSIYQVIANRDFKNNMFTDRNMVLPFWKELENGHSEIRAAVEMTYPQGHMLGIGERRLKKTGYTVSGHFFDVFTFHFLKGDPATAIADPTSIVLTESTAKAFFGNTDPVNKAVVLDNGRSLKVSAVVADPPVNSTLAFDFIDAFDFSDADLKNAMNEWQNSSWNVFVQLAPGASVASVEKTVNDIKRLHSPEDKVSSYFLFPMSKWRLYSDFKDGKNVGGIIDYVRLFIIIAVIILVIACINFMNLSTARSDKRAREVGIRKTLGSDKRQLRVQFLLESILLTLIAFAFALVAVILLLPFFNTLVDKHLVLQANDPFFWTALVGIIVVTGFVAGSYPAFYLSAFNPVKVLKGTVTAGPRATVARRVLVVMQFVVAILLVSATIIVYSQLQFIRHRDMGYNLDNLIQFENPDSVMRSFPAFKQDLLRSGDFSAVTRTMSPSTAIYWHIPAPDWKDKPAGLEVILTGQMVSPDYVKTLGIKMLEGNDFAGVPADSGNMILNKSAVEAMHLTHPVGQVLNYGPHTFTVIGVMDNMVMESPFKPVDPLMVRFNPRACGVTAVRLNSGIPPQRAIATLTDLVKKYDPQSIFEYQFTDEAFGKKFLAEELISKLTNIFAGLAIFICCLGLAGLASFTMEKRVREFGIRKVLGATVTQLLGLISREFLLLVFIAFLIAVPITWWTMHSWLEKYSLRIAINPWIFLLVGGMVLALTLLIVGLNTVRGASRSPVKSLRTE